MQSLRKGILSLLCILILSASAATAQIYRYTTATNGAPFSVASNSSGSNLTRVNGAGIPAVPCVTGFSSNQWSLNGILLLTGPAVEVTVTPNAGYYLNLTSFSAGMRRNSSGPPIVKFVYSIDGGLTWVQQVAFQAPFNSSCGNVQVGTWDFPDFSSATAVKFRIYGFSATSVPNGQMQIINLNVNGTVSTTPIGSAATVTAQPSSLTVCEGQTASFTINASGVPAPTIQWQVSTNGGVSYSDIGGANALTYSFSTVIGDNNKRYRAYVSNAGGSDTSSAAILTVNPLATSNAGANATICSSSSYTLSGAIGGGASSATWSTSGDGSFGNVNILNTSYTPGTNDKLAGTVTLTLTTNDPSGPCGAAANSMTLTIDQAATVIAGGNQTICENSSVSLSGSFGGSALSSTWSSSGDGIFGNAGNPVTSYSPGTADIAGGSVTLTITTDDPAGVCAAVSASMILTVNSLPVVDAGVNQSICNTANVSLSGVVSGPVSTGTWTSAGDGSFNNPSLLNATYYPGANDILNGSVVLTLTSSDPAGPCGTVSDALTVTITSPPAAPGAITGALNVCPGTVGVPYSILPVSGATSYNWSSASWVTISGGGLAINADFSSSISNSGTFIWVKAANVCGSSTDSSKIYVRHAIDVPQFVTPLGTVCANTNGVQYKIKPIQGFSSITWSSPAGTTITSSTDTTAVIDFGPSFTSGNVTVTATHLCMTTTKSVAVSQGITRVPANISGPAYGVCDTTVSYSIAPVVGASSYLWTAPSGGTIIGSATGLSVTIQFIAGYTTGVLSVVSFNSCNLQSGARSLTVRGFPQGPTAISGPATICANQSGVVFSVAPTPATWTYLWTVPATASIVSGQLSTSITVNFGAAGGSVNVRSQRPCGQSGVFSKVVTVNCRLADLNTPLQLIPNPANDQVKVQGLDLQDEAMKYEIVDVTGRRCIQGQWAGTESNVISTSALKDGMYFISVFTASGIRTSQLIINH